MVEFPEESTQDDAVNVTFEYDADVLVALPVHVSRPAIVMAELTGILAMAPAVNVGVKVTGVLVDVIAVPIVPETFGPLMEAVPPPL